MRRSPFVSITRRLATLCRRTVSAVGEQRSRSAWEGSCSRGISTVTRAQAGVRYFFDASTSLNSGLLPTSQTETKHSAGGVPDGGAKGAAVGVVGLATVR